MISVKPGVQLPPELIRAIQTGQLSQLAEQQLFTFFLLISVLPPEALMDPELPIVLTDWYRTPQQNAAVGGVANSLHVRGLAIDVRYSDAGFFREIFSGLALTPKRAVESAELEWRKRGFDAVREGDHVHFELDPR